VPIFYKFKGNDFHLMAKQKETGLDRRKFINKLVVTSLVACSPFPKLALAQSQSATENTFVTPPYLQNVSADGATIIWITTKNCLAWVEIEEEGKVNHKIFAAKNGLVATGRIHQIKLTALSPGTTYRYSIHAKEIIGFKPYKITYGNTISQKGFSFSTPAQHGHSVNFIVLNDMHNHPESIRHLLKSYARPEEYDFVVLNGDMFDFVEQEEKIVSDVLLPLSTFFSSSKPFFMVQGNHEVRGSYARQLFDYFDYKNDHCYYAFTQGPVRFVILDSGEDKEDGHPDYAGLVAFDPYREEQAQWLRKEIESPEFRKAAFRIIFIHIPPFYSGDWHGTTHCQQLFNPIFNNGKVDLVISGHTHTWGTYPDTDQHHYPIMIGGGPKPGTRTIIKAKVDQKTLNIKMLNDEGIEVGALNLKKK
jgi:predicted phosphodiesterase